MQNTETAAPDHRISKPVLFVSHASSDAEFANAIKQEVEKVFANGVAVFCTSSPGAIPVGIDWLSNIEEKLNIAKAVIAIVTPVSIERPWLWFEIGATWLKGRSGECRIYPLCAPEVRLSDLPSPLDRLQALSMGKAADLKCLFEALVSQFGFGSISALRPSNVTSRIPKYKDVKLLPPDSAEKAFYSGKYEGYTDQELAEIIDTELFQPEEDELADASILGREELIKNGKLIHFRKVDRDLELPPGTAQRLLDEVAARYGLEPHQRMENVVRYKRKKRRG